jgi:hypothetical protein
VGADSEGGVRVRGRRTSCGVLLHVDQRQAGENPEYGTDDCRLCGPADGSWKGTIASGDSKVTDEGMRAVRGLPALTSKWYNLYNTPV